MVRLEAVEVDGSQAAILIDAKSNKKVNSEMGVGGGK